MDEKALFLKFWKKEATATRKVMSHKSVLDTGGQLPLGEGH